MIRSAVMSVISPELFGNNPRDHGIDEQANVRSTLLRRSETGDKLRSRRKGPALTRLNCLALIIGLQIGSGIFSAPSLISQQVNSPAEGLGVFVELGLLVPPSNGGIQEYLRASWGDYMGYLFSWIWVGVAKPAGNAVISTIFADYLLKALRPADPILPWTTKIVALSCVASLTVINCLGATAGAKAANVFMMLKLASLGSIIIIGPSEPSLWGSLGSFSTAVFAALFCYGGWESVGFLTGDMENPTKDLPIVINGAMTLVIIGFFLMNASLYVCLPFDVIRESKAVAVEFANRTIGPWGGLMFSVVVAMSAMGAANANMFAVAKLGVAASQRAYFPLILANLHCSAARDEAAYLRRALPWPFRLPVLVFARLTRRLRWEHSVPIFALLLNWVLTSFFILVGSFNGLITLIEMIKAFCYMMSVLGIFILRRQVDKQVPTGSNPTYRTWIGNPIIFASVSGLLIIRGALSAPLQGPAIIFFITLGLAVLYRRFSPRAHEAPPPV
ncbi:amino acid/polyamine transporter I [Xylariaceae sp. AK1471]|nr:amino acid/polyamine transporter I [Xylariaceae sp. AK1471]